MYVLIVGVFVVVINTLAMGVALYFSYYVLKMYTVLTTFLYSKLLSFLYWFIWTAPYFSFKYTRDRKAFYRDLLRKQTVNPMSREAKSGPRINSATSLLRSTDDGTV